MSRSIQNGETATAMPYVIALLMDGMWTHDLANVIQVFGNGVPLRSRFSCDLSFVSAGKSVELDHGISVRTIPFSMLDEAADLVCVPGFMNPLEAASSSAMRQTASWLREIHDVGAEVASLGTGAFVLGATGLLDGVGCTTHHAYAEGFRNLFPSARLQEDSILTHDERRRIWTSAGGASGLDLCLSLVAHLSGPVAASEAADAMSLWNPKPMGTRSAAFGMPETPEDERRTHDMEKICQLVRADLSRPWTVSDMARLDGSSIRTFQRHFAESTGQTPKSWLSEQRVELASMFLVQTDLSMPVIAARVGLSSADTFYRVFVSVMGESPSSYRRRFTEG